jgi:hypothetical protein
MGYRVNYRGLEVACDSFADLDALAEHLAGSKASPTKSSGNGSVQPAEQKPATLKEFVQTLSLNPKNLLRALVKAESHKMRDIDLCHALGLKNTQALSGVISTLHRTAGRAGLKVENFFEKQVDSSDPKNKIIEFSIRPSALEQVREGVSL